MDYLIARCWEMLSPSDAIRKIPNVAWGVGTLLTYGLLVARRVSARTGLLAAALLASAPFHVRYSQELRPYSLSLFFLCLTLLLLDRYLERPNTTRLLFLYLSVVAAVYTAYLLQVILCLAAAALLIEDATGGQPVRRAHARRFLLWSPLFVVLVAVVYLPWLPVQLRAARSPVISALLEPFGFHRVGRLLSFFFFAPDGSYPLGRAGAFYLALVIAGSAMAVRRAGARFLLAWSFGGLAVTELLLRVHPHWDVARLYLPSGIALLALAAIPLNGLLQRPRLRWLGALVLALVLTLDARGLSSYFREGRADWRPLGRFLNSRPKSERIFTENQYAELCVAFYVEGPQWLFRGGHLGRDVWNLDGEVVRLTWSWKRGEIAWLVLAGEPEYPSLRAWAKRFPMADYPSAEGAVLVKLDPAMRDVAFSRP